MRHGDSAWKRHWRYAMNWTKESRQALIGAEVLSGLAAFAMKEMIDKDDWL
jgi:hypothetical protein